MFIKTVSKLIYTSTFMLFILSTAVQAEEQAGMVIIAAGEVSAQKDGQSDRALKRRSKFYTGETIIVGSNGKAQVRFLDGTILSLKSDTELRIEAFSYNDKERTDDANIVTLLKGGFRTITGAVAKKNPANHQVNTPVATIGVRGTNYSVAIDESVYVGVWDGIVFVENDVGSIELGKRLDFSYAEISSTNTAPQGLVKPPSVLVETVAVNHEIPSKEATGPELVATDGDTNPLKTPSLPPIDYDPLTKTPVTTAPPIDQRLSDTEKSNLDSIGLATIATSGVAYKGEATNGSGNSPIIVNSAIDASTGFSDKIIRKGGASDYVTNTNVAVGSKQVYWGTWDATTTGSEATIQTAPFNPDTKDLIQDKVFWMTAQPTDSSVLASLSSASATGTWTGTAINFAGIADNAQAITSVNFDSTLNFASGAVTNTTLQALTPTDFWDIQFQDSILEGASFNLTADTAASTLNRTPSPTEVVGGNLQGIVTGDNAEGIAAQFNLTGETTGSTLNGQFVSTCATCP
ncbi:FecR domain-containing protein [Pseudomonadota bacterium]